MKLTTLNKIKDFLWNRKGFLQIPNNLVDLPINDFEYRLLSWICSHKDSYIPTITDFTRTFKKNAQATLRNLISLKEVIKLDIVKENWGDTMPTIEEIERRIDLMIEKPLYKRKEKNLEKKTLEDLEKEFEELKKEIQERKNKNLSIENKKITKNEVLEETPKNELKIVENKEILENPKESDVYKNRENKLVPWFLDPEGLINHRNIKGNKELLSLYFRDYLNFLMLENLEPKFFQLSQRIDRDTGGFKKNFESKKTFRQIDNEDKDKEIDDLIDYMEGL